MRLFICVCVFGGGDEKNKGSLECNCLVIKSLGDVTFLMTSGEYLTSEFV